MRVLIGCNLDKEGSAKLSGEIAAILKNAEITPCVVGENTRIAGEIGAEIIETPGICSFMITVGGDGTILKWGKIAAEFGLPLLGVNMGRLGFMTGLEPADVEKIPEIFKKDPNVSRRMMLDCVLFRDGEEIFSEVVLNDVTISRSSRSKLPEFVVCCGDAEVSRVRADGVILSTPTGSTAYSLSAGGPILSPDLECIEFTSLCPHTLFNRPMIFSDKQTISAYVNHYDGSKASFSVDGGNSIALYDGDVLKLSRSKKDMLLVEAGSGFYETVRGKLLTPLK